MAGHCFVMFGWSWTEASVLGSQVFRQASMEGCDLLTNIYILKSLMIKINNFKEFFSV